MSSSSKWQHLPTEAVNPASREIDRLPLPDIVDVMVRDHRSVLRSVHREKSRIARAAAIVAQQLQDGGRLVLVGAGTSGRLGFLEAAEMPPTFGVSPDAVVALIAGGPRAIFRAVEGAEDDADAGARAIARLRPTKNDVIVGISASGMTPFVRGVVARAQRAGARIVGVTCDPGSELNGFADVMITLVVGPEVIAGSTRMKAGTATKIALNMMTTAAMIRIGKTYGNLMVDVRPTNDKLRDRARRIVADATGLDRVKAGALLTRAQWNVKAAIVMHKTRLPRAKALARLRASHDSVREALLGRR
jgi:N-acetylmuramic acid 6-phosphate etherase